MFLFLPSKYEYTHILYIYVQVKDTPHLHSCAKVCKALVAR
jgi:hypothetical protein